MLVHEKICDLCVIFKVCVCESFYIFRVSHHFTLKMKVRIDMHGYTNLFTNTVAIPDHNWLVEKVFPIYTWYYWSASSSRHFLPFLSNIFKKQQRSR
jgi:hypothetical protein